MTMKEVVTKALRFDDPPYTPWSFGFTQRAADKLREHYGRDDFMVLMHNHIGGCSWHRQAPDEVRPGCFRDHFGVVWDRTVDKDIGVVCDAPIKEPTLDGYEFPEVEPAVVDELIEQAIAANPDAFMQFGIGFSLYERAWTLRGMETFFEDLVLRPTFAHQLLDAIADLNCRLVEIAVKHPIDCVHFGDDWGCQRGLILGYERWSEFIKPRFARMCRVATDAGKFVSMHSCGKVQELFPDLVEVGLNCFNPFQPEVMDVFEMKRQWHGKLSFHGGLSTQQTLPYGTPDDVRAATRRLLDEVGAGGGYIFAPAHGVPGDVPLENLLAFIDVVLSQPGAPTSGAESLSC